MEAWLAVKRFLRRTSYLSLLAASLLFGVGCVTDTTSDNADLVLEQLTNYPSQTGSIQLEGETLVFASDLPSLIENINSVQIGSEKKELVREYLIMQKRIDCIVDKVDEAAENDITIGCDGKILVDTKAKHGLASTSEILTEIRDREHETSKRNYLNDYLLEWDSVQRINRVEESLAQMTRTNSIPLFSTLVNSIHRFPILYEGDELVTREDIPELLDKFGTLDSDEARRAMVIEHLGQ